MVSNEQSGNSYEQSVVSKTAMKHKERQDKHSLNKTEQTKPVLEDNSQLKFSFQSFERSHPSETVADNKKERGQVYQHGRHSDKVAQNNQESGRHFRHSPTWGHMVGV